MSHRFFMRACALNSVTYIGTIAVFYRGSNPKVALFGNNRVARGAESNNRPIRPRITALDKANLRGCATQKNGPAASPALMQFFPVQLWL
jgi:hypothetical protein